MGRTYQMSWEGAPKYRWVKMYQGVRYRVSCEELNAPLFTAEASYKLANAWWERKLAELTRPDPAEELLNRYHRQDLLETIQRGEAAKQLLQGLGEYPLFDTSDEEPPVTVEEDGSFNLPGVVQLVEQVGAEPVELDHTLSHQADRFLAVERARGKAPGTYGDLAYYIVKIQEECRLLKNLDVRAVNEATITDFYAWLRNESGQSPIVQKKLWGYFRRLIRFLAGQRLCPIPFNLDDRLFSFDLTTKKIKTYTIQEVRELLNTLPERLKLYALLALNCGMLGVDMATLRHEELQGDRIIRKRTKTKNNKDTPEVNYPLWQETMGLLNKYPRTHPDFVLTSKTGTPLWEARIEDGKKKKYDLVGLQWHRGRGEGRANKPSITLKALRSVSASLLESHRDYARCTTLFLGHSPSSIKDKHYAAPPQQLFDEAVLWLREQIVG